MEKINEWVDKIKDTLITTVGLITDDVQDLNNKVTKLNKNIVTMFHEVSKNRSHISDLQNRVKELEKKVGDT